MAKPDLSATDILRRLGALIAEDRAMIWLVVAFAVLLGVLGLATPIAVQALVNFVAFGGLMQPLIVVSSLLFFFLAFSGIVRVIKAYIVEILQRRIFFRVARSLAIRLPKVRFESHDRRNGPELVNRFFDVLTIQKTGSALLIDGLDVVLQSTIGLVVLGFYHPYLLIFDVILVAGIAFVLFGLGRGAVQTARRESAAKYRVAAALEEIAHAPVTFKGAGASRYAEERLAELTEGYLQARRKHFGVVLRQIGGAVSLHAIAATALLTLGGFLVIREQLTLGQLVAAELIVSVALVSFVKFGKKLESFYDLLAGVDKVTVLFDLPIDEERVGADGVSAGIDSSQLAKSAATIQLRDVDYEHASHASLFERMNLRIDAGERVAVLGSYGSGKSTIAELLGGMRRPMRGLVTVDDIDLRDLDEPSRGEQVSVVSEVDLLDTTVLENVRFGRNEIALARVREELASFGILPSLTQLPDGLQTRIAPRGPLSRREALLLTLARATVGRPRALVIDGLLDELSGDMLERAIDVLRSCEDTTLVVTTANAEIAARMDRVVQLEEPKAHRGARELVGGPS